MRLPSNGMGFLSGCMRGSLIRAFMPASRISREGQMIHEKTTVSSGLHFTAIGSDVTWPPGTSSPQHSTTLRAPFSLKTSARFSVLLERLPVCRGNGRDKSVHIHHGLAPVAALDWRHLV